MISKIKQDQRPEGRGKWEWGVFFDCNGGNWGTAPLEPPGEDRCDEWGTNFIIIFLPMLILALLAFAFAVYRALHFRKSLALGSGG